MLKQPIIEKLAAMHLLGTVEAFKTQEQDPAARELSFSERFGYWWINSGTGVRIRRSGDD